MEEKGFKKASEILSVSQPSVSLQIKNLEKNMNTIFIEKNIRKPKLTYTGIIFLNFAKQILYLCKLSQKKINEIESVNQINFKISLDQRTYKYIDADSIDIFRLKYPNVGIKLEIKSEEKVFIGFNSGNLDFGLYKVEKSLKKKLLIERYYKDEKHIKNLKEEEDSKYKFKNESKNIIQNLLLKKIVEVKNKVYLDKEENYFISNKNTWEKYIKKIDLNLNKNILIKENKTNLPITNFKNKYILKTSEVFIEEAKGKKKPKAFNKKFISFSNLEKNIFESKTSIKKEKINDLS